MINNVLITNPKELHTARTFEQRQFYRVKYPIMDRPHILILNKSFEVLDISEKGIRIFLTNDEAIPTEQISQGIIIIGKKGIYPIYGALSICRDYELLFEFKHRNPLEIASHDNKTFRRIRHKLNLKFRVRQVLCDLVQILNDKVRLRYSEHKAHEFLPNINGIFITHYGEKLHISGEIIRMGHGYVALELTTPIPYKIIIGEQKYINKRYLN